MEGAIYELVDKTIFFFFLGAMLGLGALLIKLLFFRSIVRRFFGVVSGKSKKKRRVEPEGVVKTAEFIWANVRRIVIKRGAREEKERHLIFTRFLRRAINLSTTGTTLKY